MHISLTKLFILGGLSAVGTFIAQALGGWDTAMNEQNEQRYSLPEKTLDAMLQYLATKPYNEVAQLISAMHKYGS